MTSIATIPGYSHAIGISNGRVYCAAKGGDDTYPHVVDWAVGRSCRLNPLCFDRAQIPMGERHVSRSRHGFIHETVYIFALQSNAHTATEWLEYIVIILDKSVEAFNKSDLYSGELGPATSSVKGILSFPLSCDDPTDLSSLAEAKFGSSEVGDSCRNKAILRFYGRRNDGKILTGFVMSEEETDSRPTLKLKGVWIGGMTGSKLLPSLWLVVGRSFHHAVHLHAVQKRDQVPLTLSVLRRDGTAETNNNGTDQVSFITSVRIEGIELPLLQFTSGLDFDEASGLLVIGTTLGDFCLIRFLREFAWVPGTLLTDLPKLEAERVSILSNVCLLFPPDSSNKVCSFFVRLDSNSFGHTRLLHRGQLRDKAKICYRGICASL